MIKSMKTLCWFQLKFNGLVISWSPSFCRAEPTIINTNCPVVPCYNRAQGTCIGWPCCRVADIDTIVTILRNKIILKDFSFWLTHLVIEIEEIGVILSLVSLRVCYQFTYIFTYKLSFNYILTSLHSPTSMLCLKQLHLSSAEITCGNMNRNVENYNCEYWQNVILYRHISLELKWKTMAAKGINIYINQGDWMRKCIPKLKILIGRMNCCY